MGYGANSYPGDSSRAQGNFFFGEATEPSCVPVHTFEIPILKDAKMRISAALSGFKRTSEPWDHMHTNDQVSSVLLPISRVVPHGL